MLRLPPAWTPPSWSTTVAAGTPSRRCRPEPPTVYSDGFTGSLYLDKPAEVQSYESAFEGIWYRSLDEQASRRLIDDMAGRHGQD